MLLTAYLSSQEINYQYLEGSQLIRLGASLASNVFLVTSAHQMPFEVLLNV